ncbi:acriflavine resistance protein B [Scytonema hofmannii PCC 7110]|uniref:Acriflavine resistance protein B n=1 Tax=Scytonema hofmannii PCC 7110 TaxID=128403 RepID=A0A139WTX0_9CYAN|nr:efflux RND transporter permease subunit [Scytonema hofmannii]KYC35869.1 acriflavine resistance protein B [Scytonema hofmannii PCC 7110]
MLTLFYRNRQLLILTLTLILVWGLSSFFSLPRLEDPEITQRVATVTTLFPGATAERVEILVTEPIEQELSEIEEVDVLESRSDTGISIVTVNLKETVEDVEKVWAKIRSQIDDAIAQLPPGALQPKYEDQEVKANSLIAGLVWQDNTPVNYAVLRRLSETLEDRVRSLYGTDKVELFGDPEEEIRVEINPAHLAMLGLTTEELSRQIQASDAKVSAGQLRSTTNELLFEVSGELDSLDRIRNIPIRANRSAQVTRLSDIAQVSKGITEPANSLAFVSGNPAIIIAATVESGIRVDTWAESARQVLKKFQSELPNGISIKTVLDQSHYVKNRIRGVIQELVTGSVLAMIVILFTMGWRSAVVVGATLPLATLLVFGGMKVLGVPLHQISMTGLIIAIGLLIDNAICMADEVQIRLHQGMSSQDAISRVRLALRAITDSVRHMGIPLLSSTVTTVLAFLPIALAPGGVGEFTGTIGISGILGLVSSLLISLAILPALSGLLHTRKQNSRIPTWLEQGFSHPSLTRVYRWTLQKTFSRPMLAVSLALLMPVTGFTLSLDLKQQFFPPAGRNQFYIDFELPSQAALSQTQAQVLQARNLILKHPDIVDVHWLVGESAPTFYYNVVGKRENAANYAQGLVQLRPNVLPSRMIQSLQDELDKAFPSAQVLVRQIEQGPPFDAPVEVRVYGPDLEKLREFGNQIRAELSLIQDVLHTRASLTEAQPKLAIKVDEEQARVVGLDRSAIARQLDTTLEGTTGGSVLESTEELPVRVRISDSNRSDLDRIATLDLLPNQASNSENNQTIPLASVGEVQLVPDLAVIPRRDRRRVNIIQGFITAGALPAVVLSEFQQRIQLKKLQLPPGYTLEFGGEAEERGTAIANLLSTVGVLGVLMTATLVLTFNSFALAGCIGIIALLSVGLGLLALWISGYPFGFTAILGTIGLIGIAVNEATVVLAALQADPRARLGDRSAVQEVVVSPPRHMIATTITDTAGFTPLLFDPTGFWNPLAIIIAGGLGGVCLLSLYFVPSVYLLLTRRKKSVPNSASKPILLH